MKVIIAGSRSVRDYKIVESAIADSGFEVTEVVCGMASGPDLLGKQWADYRGVPVTPFLPDWKKHGKSAGHVRNRAMGDYADALIAVWDGSSRGTMGMISYARARGLKVFVKRLAVNPRPQASP